MAVREENGIFIFDKGFIIESVEINQNTSLDENVFGVVIVANVAVTLKNPALMKKHNYYIVNRTAIDININVEGGGYVGNTGTNTSILIKSGEAYHLKNDTTRWLILSSHRIITTTNVLNGNSSIDQPSWNGSQTYSKVITINGAQIGQKVDVWFDLAMTNTIFSGGNRPTVLYGVVSATNQVTVYAVLNSYVVIPSGAQWQVRVS